MTGRLSDKHGLELVEHILFYGASREELEELSAEQLDTLAVAGLVERAEP